MKFYYPCTGCKNQGYLCPGNARNQGIRSYCIDLSVSDCRIFSRRRTNTHTYIYLYIGPEWHFLYGTTKKVIDNQIWIWNQHKYVWVALAYGGSRVIHFLQLRRFLRSLDGFTNTGGSPKCFTLPHALWRCYLTKHQRMAQVGTW